MTKDEFEDLYGASKLDIKKILNITIEEESFSIFFNKLVDEGKLFDNDIWQSKNIEDLKNKIRKVLIEQQQPKDSKELKEIPKCFYCRQPMFSITGYKSAISGDIEHILDKSNIKYRYFVFSPFNLALACRRCNFIKTTTDLLPNYKINNIEQLQKIPYLQNLQKNIKTKPEEKEKLKHEIENIITNNKDIIVKYNTDTDLIENKIFTKEFKDDFLWIHPYYDHYHEYIEIIYPDITNENFKTILYRVNSKANGDKKIKAGRMLQDLKLDSAAGLEEIAYKKRIEFLWKQMNILKEKIETSDIEDNKKDRLIRALNLSFQILCRNL